MTDPDFPNVPPAAAERRASLARVREELADAERIVLTTHVNADGDGTGSQGALAAWLARRGKRVAIMNPTPFPDRFRHLIEDQDWIVDPKDENAGETIERADLFVVLDTGEPGRIGRMADALEGRRVAVVDHHPPGDSDIEGPGPRDPTACAAAELVYDLFTLPDGGGADEPWPAIAVEGLYTAILTDTGSFRYSNTTPRTHAIASDLLRRGVDPERVYRRIFGMVPLRQIQILHAALERLEVDPVLPIAWVSVPQRTIDRIGATSEDLGGVVDYPRSIESTEVALLFRGAGEGQTKVSLRSNGEIDVNLLARRFGGGGHAKAAGALIGGPLEEVRAIVLEAAREAVAALERRRNR